MSISTINFKKKEPSKDGSQSEATTRFELKTLSKNLVERRLLETLISFAPNLHQFQRSKSLLPRQPENLSRICMTNESLFLTGFCIGREYSIILRRG